MSVVVYKDGVLAGDLQLTLGDVAAQSAIHKVANIGGHLFAGVGCPHKIADMFKWVRDRGVQNIEPTSLGSSPDFRNASEEEGRSYADFLWITPEGEIRVSDDDNFPGYFPVVGDAFCLGSGRMIAQGALEMGATAIEAVVAACKLDTACGVGVSFLTVAGDPNDKPITRMFKPLELEY
jgi:hypothetical protein